MAKQTNEYLRKSGLKIKKLREQLNYSREEMAAYLGITRPAYWKNEKGENFPGLATLTLLSKEHDISMDWFIFDKGPMNYKEKEKPDRLEKELEELKGQLELAKQEHRAELEKAKQEMETERETHEGELEKARREMEEEKEKHEMEITALRREMEGEKEKHRAELEQTRNEVEQKVAERIVEMEIKPGMKELIDHMEGIPLLYHEVMVHFQRFKKDNPDFVKVSMDGPPHS